MMRDGVGTKFRWRLRKGAEKVGRLLYLTPDKSVFWVEVAGEGEIPLPAGDILDQSPEYKGEVVCVFGWDGTTMGGKVHDITPGGDIVFAHPSDPRGPDDPLITRAITPAAEIKKIVVPLKARDKILVKHPDGTQVKGEVVGDDGLTIRLKKSDGSEEDVTVQEGDLLAVSSPMRELETVQIPLGQIGRQDPPQLPEEEDPWELIEGPEERTEGLVPPPRPEPQRPVRRPKWQLSADEKDRIIKGFIRSMLVTLTGLVLIILIWSFLSSKKDEVQPQPTTPTFMVDRVAAVERCVKTSEGRLTQADCEKEVGELVKARN